MSRFDSRLCSSQIGAPSSRSFLALPMPLTRSGVTTVVPPAPHAEAQSPVSRFKRADMTKLAPRQKLIKGLGERSCAEVT